MTSTGTAVVLLPGQKWMYQHPGGQWRRGAAVATGDQLDAHASDQRVTMLYYNAPTLGTRVLTVPRRGAR